MNVARLKITQISRFCCPNCAIVRTIRNQMLYLWKGWKQWCHYMSGIMLEHILFSGICLVFSASIHPAEVYFWYSFYIEFPQCTNAPVQNARTYSKVSLETCAKHELPVLKNQVLRLSLPPPLQRLEMTVKPRLLFAAPVFNGGNPPYREVSLLAPAL